MTERVVDLYYFDGLFHAAQRTTFEAVEAWRELGPEGQDRWLRSHEDCRCPDVLRALLVVPFEVDDESEA